MANDIKVLTLHPRVLPYYRRHVSGNVGISEDLAARKLTRNVILAADGGFVKSREAGKAKYKYGSLEILVVGDEIVWIRQWEQPVHGWRPTNKARRDELNGKLGIKPAPAKAPNLTSSGRTIFIDYDVAAPQGSAQKIAPQSLFQRVRSWFNRKQSAQEAI